MIDYGLTMNNYWIIHFHFGTNASYVMLSYEVTSVFYSTYLMLLLVKHINLKSKELYTDCIKRSIGLGQWFLLQLDIVLVIIIDELIKKGCICFNNKYWIQLWYWWPLCVDVCSVTPVCVVGENELRIICWSHMTTWASGYFQQINGIEEGISPKWMSNLKKKNKKK